MEPDACDTDCRSSTNNKMSSQPLSQAAANCSHNDEVKIPAAIVYTINNAFHSM